MALSMGKCIKCLVRFVVLFTYFSDQFLIYDCIKEIYCTTVCLFSDIQN